MAVLIPFGSLSEEAQLGVIDEFILREGTDYGSAEATLERKRSDVRAQILRRDALLVFDPDTESVTLMTARQAKEWITP